jgi:hypothetical protein
MSDLPKPVAHVGWVGNKVQYVHAGGTPGFTETQLLTHAAQCVAEERAKHAALVEAADGLRDVLREVVTSKQLQARIDTALAAYEGARK